jgi:SAM-dependent methyltransferase
MRDASLTSFAIGLTTLVNLPCHAQSGAPQPTVTAPPAAPPTTAIEPTVVDEMKSHAAAITPLLQNDLAKRFVAATAALPVPPVRTVYRNRIKDIALTQQQYDRLPEADRDGLVEKACDPLFYYYTGYGTPLAYARPIDLAAGQGLTDVAGKKVLDFGYGSIGHLRLLAAIGADAHGIEINPIFAAMYSAPGDQGEVPNNTPGALAGSIKLHHGRWPADESLAKDVGDSYDLFISKNVLKRGYIHPARQADPRFLINLGVDDKTFLASVNRTLKPGGLLVIFNISPKQNPDGRCAFDKVQLEDAGFEVLEFDRDDSDAVCQQWVKFGYDEGKGIDSLRQSTFAWSTIARKR